MTLTPDYLRFKLCDSENSKCVLLPDKLYVPIAESGCVVTRRKEPFESLIMSLAQEENCTMTCGRCGGLMVVETICAEAKESWGGVDLPVIRCLNCGNIEDSVIRWHRVMRPARGQAVRQAEDIEGHWTIVP